MSTDPDQCCSVQVVVRMRPLNERELKGNTLPVVTASSEKKEIVVIKGAGNRQQRTTYNFDNVLGTQSSQEDVFEQTIQPVISDVLGGFECTMFAYGQTGTGKTHTMEGDLSNSENQGVIPRAAQAIFDQLSDPKFRDSEVTASYLEIYNEELSDLLVEGSTELKLQICEDNKPRGKGLFVQNLSEMTVNTPADVLGLMQRAQLRRQVGETKMNKQSSRSHCLFTLKVHSKKIVSSDGQVMECTGKLHLVDLAGSECAKTAGNDKVDPAKERERKNINQSLLTLGRVISALREGPSGRIPYRDSKLTRLLQESLGGRCKTVIIATVSPSVLAVDETISTLNYAQAAHGIQNKPVATSYLKLGDGKQCAGAAGSGAPGAGLNVQDWNQMECRLQYLQAELEEAQAALSRKHQQQQLIIDRAEAAETQRDTFAAQLDDSKKELDTAFSRNGALLKHLELTRQDLSRIHRLVDARKQTEEALTCEATDVLTALAKCVADGQSFHTQLVQHAEAEVERRAKSSEFHGAFSGMLMSLGAQLHKYSGEVSMHLKAVVEQSKDVERSSAAHLDKVQQSVHDIEASIAEHCGKARTVVEEGAATTAQQLEGIQAASDANGQALSSAVQTCDSALRERMQALQQKVALSEQELAKWSHSAGSTLEATCAQLTKLLQEHEAATAADEAASAAQLVDASRILGEQKASLEALAADLASQRALQQQLSDSLSHTSQLCASSSGAHAEALRGNAQTLAVALAAQQRGQLDAALVETLGQARALLAERAGGLGGLAAAQKQSLATALQVLVDGTIDEVHAGSISSLRQYVEDESAAECKQLTAQREQLEAAREQLRAGNAETLHRVAIEELRGAFAEKMDVERKMLAAQKCGLQKSAADLESQKDDERKLLDTLESESKQLREIVQQQKEALEAQAVLLQKQEQEIAAALAAQKEGQTRMLKVMKEELGKTIAAEMQMRAAEEAANRARAEEEAARHSQMLEEEKRIREEVEAAAKARAEEAQRVREEEAARHKQMLEEEAARHKQMLEEEKRIREEVETAAKVRAEEEKRIREEEAARHKQMLEEEAARHKQMLEEERSIREEVEAAAQMRAEEERRIREEEAARHKQMLEEEAARHKQMLEEEKRIREKIEAAAKTRAEEEAARHKQMLEEERRMREKAEAAAKERQSKAIARLEQELVGQVSSLESTMQHDVSSLVDINGQITEHNSNVFGNAKAVDACMLQLQEQASEFVRVWGGAVASVKENVDDMLTVNANISREVVEVDKIVVDASGALLVETATWGQSNNIVEQAIVETIQKNTKLAADVEKTQKAVDEKSMLLQSETAQWRASNHDVMGRINAIILENEGIAVAVANASTSVDAIQTKAIAEVKAWGESDRTCQASMQTAIHNASALADTIISDQNTLNKEQDISAEQLNRLTVMTQGNQVTVSEQTASNQQAQNKANDLVEHVKAACANAAERTAAIEHLQSSAIGQVSTSVTDMMAPRPGFLSAFSQDGQKLLDDISSAVAKTAELVSAQQSSLDAARGQAVASCEHTTARHLKVIVSLEAVAAAQREAACAHAEQARSAMAVGPKSCSLESDALAGELASFETVHTQGSTDLAACVDSYCTQVAKKDEEVAAPPTLHSFDTDVAFSSTAPDNVILSDFSPVVDMSDLSSPSKQVMPVSLPGFTSTDDELEQLDEEAENVQPETSVESVDEEGEKPRPQTATAVVSEKKRKAVPTPKKSTGRQATTEKPATKIAATGSSRLPVHKPRTSLREINTGN